MKTVVYIDGFNLYFSLKRFGKRKLYWLDVGTLSDKLAQRGAAGAPYEARCRYFTARISGNQKRQARQNLYLEAVEDSGVEVIYGNYRRKELKCRARCKDRYFAFEEKETDVNIALAIAEDAMKDQLDHAILVSNDTDLFPPLKFLKENFPRIQRTVAFPLNKTGQVNRKLKSLCSGKEQILTERLVMSCLFPKVIEKKNGFKINCPDRWK